MRDAFRGHEDSYLDAHDTLEKSNDNPKFKAQSLKIGVNPMKTMSGAL